MLAKELKRALQSKAKTSSQFKYDTIFEEAKQQSQVVSVRIPGRTALLHNNY